MKTFEIDAKDIADQYGFTYDEINIKEIEKGNINNTFVIILKKGKSEKKYLCQRVNTKVFTKPFSLMRNIQNVTTYISNYYKNNNDSKHKTLEVIPTITGSPLYITKNALGDNEFFRVYNYIDNSVSYDKTDDDTIIKTAGKAFGSFSRALDGYPTDLVEETIENFHNTPLRYERFLQDLEIDAAKRSKYTKEEIEFFKSKKEEYGLIYDKIKNGEIPIRVTHNDTKINNVMLDKNSNDYIAVIDLDTVMPGSILYDYGDGVRSSCATRVEDSKDISNVDIDNKLFEAYTEGFLSEVAKVLKEKEVDNMANSIKIMTLELALRFYNDYINGDTYFRTTYSDHNLVRTRNQIELVRKIEKKKDYLESTIHSIYDKYK